ncbi:unnamed protein product [Eruca vesicaria subsp. sativa]|uniref:DC1 domain-containing protein n=1 Tax=Eruca vesicaria subsp. sativa TaxID=29727 RepID=A0ABC8M5W8_ERUVS|nr:unnamed protein product [Eruca vesicaria subsp. sativa]
MSSLGHPPLSRLICPAERTKHNQELSWKGVDGVFFLVLDNYYILSGEDDDSSYSHHLYPLFWCNNKESKEKFRFSCGACRCLTSGTDYYFCNECDESYHKECVESPPIMESVFHPKHHLQLVSLCHKTNSHKL